VRCDSAGRGAQGREVDCAVVGGGHDRLPHALAGRLRHAHASWRLAGGADLKSVMERMGHAQIMTTQKYLHALPDADQKNLAAFDRTLNRTTP
jgi:integrase